MPAFRCVRSSAVFTSRPKLNYQQSILKPETSFQSLNRIHFHHNLLYRPQIKTYVSHFKLPFGPMPEKVHNFNTEAFGQAIERIINEINDSANRKDPATNTYPSFSNNAKDIINDIARLVDGVEKSSWNRVDNPYLIDEFELIESNVKKYKSRLSKQEMDVVNPLLKKAQYVVKLWQRVNFAFNVLDDMYARYHNQGRVTDDSQALKAIYEEYVELKEDLKKNETEIQWFRSKTLTDKDIDQLLNEEEKKLLEEGDDHVLGKVRFHAQMKSFDEFELVCKRVEELLTAIEHYRGQSGIRFKGMDVDVFK